jgi:hypothetical protein
MEKVFEISDGFDLSNAIFAFHKELTHCLGFAGVAEVRKDHNGVVTLSVEAVFDPELHSIWAEHNRPELKPPESEDAPF